MKMEYDHVYKLANGEYIHIDTVLNVEYSHQGPLLNGSGKRFAYTKTGKPFGKPDKYTIIKDFGVAEENPACFL